MRVCALAIVFLLGACNPPRSTLEISALRSAVIEGIEDEPILLKGGLWEGEPFVEGGAARPSVGLVEDLVVYGEFLEPGREDCAVLVWHQTGGSGTRLWLVVLTAAPERPRSVATELVGDRVQVIHLCYVDEQIRLELIAHGPGDAACCPGQFERRSFRPVGGELVSFTEIVGRASTRDLGGEVWQLASLGQGDAAEVPLQVTLEFDGSGNVLGESGCNSYGGTVVDGDGRDLEISAAATSARRCPEEGVEMQAEFLRRLGAVERYSFRDGRLVLHYGLEGEADAMTFVSLRP